MQAWEEHIRKRFIKGLKDYLSEVREEYLTEAYEMGRASLLQGLGELDIIELYHEALNEINNGGGYLDTNKKLNNAAAYLSEWLAPFEVRLSSYKELIDELNKKNELLQEEIESRKRFERELQKSKRHFQSLIENAQDIITLIDYKGIIDYSSPAVERILGYHQNELTGENAFEYIHPEDVKSAQEAFNKVIEKPGQIVLKEYRFKHKNGNWRYLESFAKNVVEDKEKPVVVINSRDITERELAMQKLEESKIQLAEAQQIAKVGSWSWNPNKEKGLDWSEEMCRIFGLDPHNFDHSYELFMSYVHPDDQERVAKIISDALEKKNFFSFEHRIIREDQEERIMQCRGQIVAEDDGAFVHVLGTGQDITDSKKREQKLKEYSERLRKLSARLEQTREEERIKISRAVHDELGQMLTVLKMDISIFSGEMKNNVVREARKSFNEQAKEILERINVIIESVQQITSELRPEVLDDLGLKDAIDWQANEFGKRTGMRVNFNTNINETDFLDDEQSTTLFRIFQEILINIMRHAQASKIEIYLKKEVFYLHLIVKDNGVGITENQKDASSSLGIIGMRERTQLLGGDVQIEGTESKGTTISLRIPLNRNQ